MNEDTCLRLIAKKLSGSITSSEEDFLKQWISDSAENELLYVRLENYWTKNLLEIRMEGQQKAFERIAKTLDIPTGIEGHEKKTKIHWVGYLWKVAASIVLIFAVGSAIRYAMDNHSADVDKEEQIVSTVSKSNPKGQKSLITLPDGSKVKLNAESYLEYENDFSETRQVKLVGEAFFEVVKDTARVFLVHIGDVQVGVLGTSFNIQAYPFKNTMSVAVASGKVRVSRKNNEGITRLNYLEKDEMISIDHQSGQYEKKLFDPEELLAWKDGILIFKQEPYNEIFDRLERWYGVEFVIKKIPDIKEGFTARYHNNTSLEMVLEGVSFTSGIKYRIEGKKVIIE